MSGKYYWRVYCLTENTYRSTLSDTEPTVCPLDSGPIDSSITTIISTNFLDLSHEGYVNVESKLADSSALKLLASDTYGGILLNAGLGGILANTTNAIQLDAAAASNFTTTSGNLTLNASTGLTYIDGGSGINIGNGSSSTPIYLGTASYAKMINIGNNTSSTGVSIFSGTGGFLVDTANGGSISLDAIGASSNFTLSSNANGQDLTIALTGSYDSSIILDSQGTGLDAIKLNSAGGLRFDCASKCYIVSSSTASDAIRLNTGGGLDVDTSGVINLATGDNTGGAITLDAAYNNGGITISSGSQGIAINSNGGLIGIGNWSGGDISIGAGAVARSISMGNSTSTTGVSINTGTTGFTLDTTNGGTISLDAIGASCNFSLASNANSQDLTIGLSGAYDSSIIINSTGTGSDAIRLNATAGGIDIDATGLVNVTTTSSSSSAFVINTATNNGGIALTSGTQGIAINATGGTINIGNNTGGDIAIGSYYTGRAINLGNSATGSSLVLTAGSNSLIMNSYNGGVIGIGSWNPSDIYIGTVAASLNLSLGNSTGTTAVSISSGTGGIVVGNDANSGEIQIANGSTNKVVTIGNSINASRLIERWGTSGYICTQLTPVALSDADATLTIANLLIRLLTGAPSTTRTLTLPNGSDIVTGIPACQVGDSFEFSIINTSSGTFTLANGTGGNNIGTLNIPSNSSGTFKIRLTNVSSGTEAYTIYRTT